MILSYIYIEGIEKATRREARQMQSDAARKLLKNMLVYCGISESSVERDDNGRPYLSGCRDIDFNFSHSGNIAVCALSVGEGRVGVDVENSELCISEDHRERFVKRYLKPKNDINDLAEAWTAREAYLKYLGTGLSGGISSVDPGLDSNIRIECLRIEKYCVSVCLEKDRELKVIYPLCQEKE